MARKRVISPEIWQSEDFSKLSLLARLVFIGLFSHADDEGRGRAKAAYVKSIIFPYDEGMRVADIDKALSEIAQNMSVTFYTDNGNEYYCLDNWLFWQRVDKPQESKLPAMKDKNSIIRRTFGECSSNSPRQVPPNRKEENKENISTNVEIQKKPKTKFQPPTLEEIREYCLERKSSVDPATFYDYFQATGWVDSRGNPVTSWKGKVITWETKGQSRRTRPEYEELAP